MNEPGRDRFLPCEYDMQECSKEQHRLFIQEVQRDLETWEFDSRLEVSPPHQGYGYCGDFEVYWGGWHRLAWERDAMTPTAKHAINRDLWLVIQADAARSLTR